MAAPTFAAIDIGSYNVSMEIFEVRRSGLKSLTTLRQRLLLGRDSYSERRISMDILNELTRILKDYSGVMKEYGVSAYRACAKSALREAGNRALIVEHVKKKTGILIDILSNAEHRFLGYKSIASKGEDFARIIEKGTAIVDVGGGSIQISLFDKDTLVTTANLLLGSLRVSGRIASLESETEHLDVLIDQLIRKDILNFRRMYLKDRDIDTIILVGDYFTNLIFQNKADVNKFETRDEFLSWYDKIVGMTAHEAAEYLGVGMEVAHAVLPTAVLYRRLIEVLGASTVWLPGIQLTDGIAYDYGLEAKIIKSSHDFDRDILMAARNIMKRYAGNKPHTEKLLEVSDEIFKAIRKSNFLSDRDRLLLKVACCLHDCGKYVSLVNVSECSYNIIMSTEIIGLSERERVIIANVVKYNTVPFDFYGELSRSIPEEDFLRVAKLTAILRISNGLDQSYLQKIEQIRVQRKDEKLLIEVVVKEDFTLEKGLFGGNVSFFEDIFDLTPVLKIKKRIS